MNKPIHQRHSLWISISPNKTNNPNLNGPTELGQFPMPKVSAVSPITTHPLLIQPPLAGSLNIPAPPSFQWSTLTRSLYNESTDAVRMIFGTLGSGARMGQCSEGHMTLGYFKFLEADSLASSCSCCFLRWLWAVLVTILAKKLSSINQTILFQMRLNEIFHCFFWGEEDHGAESEMSTSTIYYHRIWNINYVRQLHPGSSPISRFHEHIDSSFLGRGERGDEQTFSFGTWWIVKYFSFSWCRLEERFGNLEENPGMSPSIQISSFSTNSKSWLLNKEMIKIVCIWDWMILLAVPMLEEAEYSHLHWRKVHAREVFSNWNKPGCESWL